MRMRSALTAAAIAAALVLAFFGGRASAPAPVAQNATKSTSGQISNAVERTSVTAPPALAAASQTKEPLPAPGTPLKQIMAELRARAESGDAEAASRLFRDTQRCAEVRHFSTSLPRMTNVVLDQMPRGSSRDALKQQDRVLEVMQKMIAFTQDNAALCAGLSDEETNEAFPLSLRAAQLGDADAADCYLSVTLFGLPGLIDHPDWLTTYKDNALTIASAAVARGDWLAAWKLSQAYETGTSSTTLLGQVTRADPVLSYRYFRLLQLGLGSDSSSITASYFSDEEAKRMLKDVPPDAARDAEAWAQDTFRRNFSANPQHHVFERRHDCPVATNF